MTKIIRSRALYLHIPFCRHICTYCDYPVTPLPACNLGTCNLGKGDGSGTGPALATPVSPEHTSVIHDYFNALESHLRYWTGMMAREGDSELSSIYIGGGTPSLFTHHYQPLFSLLAPFISPDCEITLECNPTTYDLSQKHAFEAWQQLGINRLSLGVQSWQPRHLTYLQRQHTSSDGLEWCLKAREYFPQINIDLLYGLPSQSLAEWSGDLKKTLQSLNPETLSLYLLSGERNAHHIRHTHQHDGDGAAADQRPSLSAHPPNSDFYHLAREVLSLAGYRHLEVSHFSKPCPGPLLNSEEKTKERDEKIAYTWGPRHTSRYWFMQSYIGVGAGAHGYEITPGMDHHTRASADDHSSTQQPPHDVRYSFPLSPSAHHKTTPQSPHPTPTFAPLPATPHRWFDFLDMSGAIVDRGRDADACVLETIATSIATSRGVFIKELTEKYHRQWQPTPDILKLLDQGTAQLSDRDDELKIHPSLWLQSSTLTLQLYESLPRKKPDSTS